MRTAQPRSKNISTKRSFTFFPNYHTRSSPVSNFYPHSFRITNTTNSTTLFIIQLTYKDTPTHFEAINKLSRDLRTPHDNPIQPLQSQTPLFKYLSYTTHTNNNNGSKMLFPIYSILFAAAASAIAVPNPAVTVSSVTRPARLRRGAPAIPAQIIENSSFEVASANPDGIVSQQTPWGRSSTNTKDFDMSGLVSNSDAPFATPYGSEF